MSKPSYSPVCSLSEDCGGYAGSVETVSTPFSQISASRSVASVQGPSASAAADVVVVVRRAPRSRSSCRHLRRRPTGRPAPGARRRAVDEYACGSPRDECCVQYDRWRPPDPWVSYESARQLGGGRPTTWEDRGVSAMQFGIFSVGDITPDPTTGRTPTEHERIMATVAIAEKVEEVGLDVFATGEHHNPPFVLLVADDAPRLPRRPDEPAGLLDVDDADHHQRPGEDRRGLLGAPAPLRRPGRRDARSRQHRPGLPVVRRGHPPGGPADGREVRPAAPAVARGGRRLGGEVPHSRCTASRSRRVPWTAYRPSSGTARSARPRSPSWRRSTATASSPTTSSGRARTPSGWCSSTGAGSSTTATARAAQAIVGLGGQVFMRRNSQDAVNEFRPYFDVAPVYGHGPSLEEFTAQTPLTVGLAAAGRREDAGLPRVRRRLPAPAVPRRPRGAAAEDGPRAARPARRGGGRAAGGDGEGPARPTYRTRRPTRPWWPRRARERPSTSDD